MKTHNNIAVFIPHLGCKNSCVFCSQTKITGVERAEPELSCELNRVKNIIEEALPTLKGEAEIAFFGGSFTGIEEDRMVALLECASRYTGGKITGIRCSTRPDYVNQYICDILKYYGVRSVELGIQSTNDRVLKASNRGHTNETSKSACRLLKANGFSLGGQMMVGMPFSAVQDEIKTAEDIVSYGADNCRIYPMVVFENTKLYDMVISGEYKPLSNEEAAVRTAECAKIFIRNNVDILRIGLHSSENLSLAPFGANHPAMGELAEGEIYFSLMCERIESQTESGNKTVFFVPKGEVSKCAGHKGVNKIRLKKKYGTDIKLVEDEKLKKYDVRIRN